MPSERSKKLVKKVLNLIKSETTSSHDIIPFDELPFFHIQHIDKYVAQFGNEKIAAYIEHCSQSLKLRNLAQKLLPSYSGKTRSPNSLLKVATTLCGYGECDELSQRAAIELLARGCEDTVNLIVLRGKPCVDNPNPENAFDYYNHMIIVIGAIQIPYNKNIMHFFHCLPENYILFDPSLKLMGDANKTPQILASIFKYHGLHMVDIVVPIKPLDSTPIAYGKAMLDLAREISEIMMRNLNITNKNRISNPNMFFSYHERIPRDLESRRTILLVDDNRLDWNTCMQHYSRSRR
jgi:hypothetical protein